MAFARWWYAMVNRGAAGPGVGAERAGGEWGWGVWGVCCGGDGGLPWAGWPAGSLPAPALRLKGGIRKRILW